VDLHLILDEVVFQVDEVDDDEVEVVGKKNLTYFNNYICIFSKNVYTKINVRILLTGKHKTNDRTGRKGCISHTSKSTNDNHFPNQTI
jgi:hypothetical protein